LRNTVLPAMLARAGLVSIKLEDHVADDLWPLPDAIKKCFFN